MPRPQNKVDMAEMNAAIDKVLALPPPARAKQKKQRTQRPAGHPLPAQASKNTAPPAAR